MLRKEPLLEGSRTFLNARDLSNQKHYFYTIEIRRFVKVEGKEHCQKFICVFLVQQ